MDCSTVLGTTMILACVLSTNTLSGSAIKSCVNVFESLEDHMKLNSSFNLLPHEPMFCVEIRDGLVATSAMKNILRELGLPWCRQDAFTGKLIHRVNRY